MKSIRSAIKTELIKVINYRTFWILAGLYIATLLMVIFGVQAFLDRVTVNINNKSPLPIPSFPVYSFPGVWQNLTYIAGYLKIFPAFLIIILITNEFTFSTLRQQIITGTSRVAYLTGKILLILVFSVAIASLVGISGLIAGLLQKSPEYGMILNPGLWFIPVHAFEIFSYLIFAAFLAILFRKAGVSLVLLMLYTLIIERIIVFKLPDIIGNRMPIESIGNLIPLPNSSLMKLFGVSFREYSSWQDLVTCLVYNLVFIGIMHFLLTRKDL